ALLSLWMKTLGHLGTPKSLFVATLSGHQPRGLAQRCGKKPALRAVQRLGPAAPAGRTVGCVSLFRRQAQRLSLTPAGERLLPHAEQLEQLCRQVWSCVHEDSWSGCANCCTGARPRTGRASSRRSEFIRELFRPPKLADKSAPTRGHGSVLRRWPP